MSGDFPVIYMLILAAITVGILFLLSFMQKAVLKELYETLYKKNNPELYISMLQSKKLGLVLRKGTIELLRFDGYLYKGDEQGIICSMKTLDKLYLKPAEKLNYLQKRLSFYVMGVKKAESEKTLSLITELLKNEKNSKLKAALRDAEQLVGVYIHHETSLIDDLLKKEEKQDGNARGITQYQLAKLYFYSGNAEKTNLYLNKASKNLVGTVWQSTVEAAKNNNKLLELQ